MPEETENWWETAPEESDPDAPAPIAIRGYQAVDGKLVQKPEGEGGGSPDGGSHRVVLLLQAEGSGDRDLPIHVPSGRLVV